MRIVVAARERQKGRGERRGPTPSTKAERLTLRSVSEIHYLSYICRFLWFDRSEPISYGKVVPSKIHQYNREVSNSL
jgi:hypothetical protein